SRAYGSDHSIVIITVTPALTRDTSYTATVSNVTGEDASTLVPNPSSANFRFGYGAFCADFNDNLLPGGTAFFNADPTAGRGYITNGVIHLTDQGAPGNNV